MRTAEHEILANLRRDPGIAQQTLARRCFSAKSPIIAPLSALEARGCGPREADPAAPRATQLSLTPAGARMASRTAVVQAGLVAAMAESVSPKALVDVTAAMVRVSERLQAMLDEAD